MEKKKQQFFHYVKTFFSFIFIFLSKRTKIICEKKKMRKNNWVVNSMKVGKFSLLQFSFFFFEFSMFSFQFRFLPKTNKLVSIFRVFMYVRNIYFIY